MATQSLPVFRMRSVRRAVPAALRPLLTAYLFGYASSVTPRLLTLILKHLGEKGKTAASFRASLALILKGGLDWQRFPAFCAALVGGSTLLQV